MFVKGHPGYKRKIRPVQGSEIQFLDYYYSVDSETRWDGKRSALKAGFAQSTAEKNYKQIIRKFGDASAAKSLDAVGVNKPYLAARLKAILESGNDKDKLSGIRLGYSLLGELTEEGKMAGTNVFTGPVMLIQGMTPQRLTALRRATPQLSPAQQEVLEENEYQQRKQAWDRGELPALPSKSKAEYTGWNKDNEPLPEPKPQIERHVLSGESGQEGVHIPELDE